MRPLQLVRKIGFGTNLFFEQFFFSRETGLGSLRDLRDDAMQSFFRLDAPR
jgi:hypothetical protein